MAGKDSLRETALPAFLSNSEGSRRHLRAGDARPDLGEGGVPGSRRVVAEGGKAAVVRRAQVPGVDELRRLEHAIPHGFGGLDLRIDGGGHAEDRKSGG